MLHVFPDAGPAVTALDVYPNVHPDESLASASIALEQLKNAVDARQTLVLTDVFGATPCNMAQRLVALPGHAGQAKLLAGVNLPMLLRAVTYRMEPLESVAQKALAGAAQGVMSLSVTAPQNQAQKRHDPDSHHHQQ